MASGKEVGQFKTATAEADGNYVLTNLTRGQLETIPAAHAAGTPFVLLDEAVQFVPIDARFAGRTLLFRATAFGATPETSTPVALVYDPPTIILDGGGA